MNAHFPLYLQDRDGWMLVVMDEEQLGSSVEQNDAHYGEYGGWDSRSFPLSRIYSRSIANTKASVW